MLSPLIAGEPSTVDILEKTTARYSATLIDDSGLPVPAADLATLTLSLYVVKQDGTVGIVNSRNAQNVLNANNVTVDTLGAIVWAIQVLDTTFVEALAVERHIALFTFTRTSPALTGRHELHLMIRNLLQVS